MGVIMGTAAYMSPEQARGKTTDRRSDIWAFGVVLFEMLTGERAFVGDDVSLTLAKVLEREPSLESLPDTTPPKLRNVLQRCLEKEPRQRVQAIGDVRLAMEGAFDSRGPSGAETPKVPATRQQPTVVGLAGLMLFLVGGLAGWGWMRPPSEPVGHFVIPTRPLSMGPIESSPGLAISPDGRRLVYRSGSQLHLLSIGQVTSTTLVAEGDPAYAFFSSDGEWVGFWDATDWALKKVSVLGGPPVKICSVPGRLLVGAAWGVNDTIVFGAATAGGLWRVPASGGARYS